MGDAAALSVGDVGTFTDERDGQTYRTVKMPDGKIWLAQNFNYKPESGKWCSYGGDESLRGKYGLLYDFDTAKAVAPAGWRLPELDEDWNKLLLAVGGRGLWGEMVETVPSLVGVPPHMVPDMVPSYLVRRQPKWLGDDVAGGKLKARSGWNDFEGRSGNGTDDYGFSAAPGGFFVPGEGIHSIGYRGRWWADVKRDYGERPGSLDMYHRDDYVRSLGCDKGHGLSVRYVKSA